ncbi:hypothetical protein LBMAG33_3850 [Candidatus Levyibacteriota bacterium]|nr:S41 family peptidase [Candidatus Levybacteria bacterium]GDX62075.1 hypothetical protein LBMAG33_3850 [Candidatus Levybacteria bacterium]
MKIRSLQFLIIVLISFFVGYNVGTSEVKLGWKKSSSSISVENKEAPSVIGNVDFSQFWVVWKKIEETYYNKKSLNHQKMVNSAIAGMLQSLDDPYTVYLPPKQNDDFKQGLAGQFEGIGASLGIKDKQIIVIAPLAGSPAIKAGIKAGDTIVKIDNKPIYDWTLSQAVDKIRGPKGTNVTLTIFRKIDELTKDISIKRDTITIKSVNGWVKNIKDIDGIKKDNLSVNDSIMYISLSQFGDNTNQEWFDVVKKLSAESKKLNIKGIVFDLRNNPGGYLSDATFVASEFLKSGVVVTQDKGNGEKINFSVDRNGLFTKEKIVIILNKGSASASEIVAGALRDHKRATLVGTISFGKGTIQQAEDLGGGAGLHVTIAKWLTPNGTWVHGKGLVPDLSVDYDQVDPSHDIQLEKAIGELVK